VGRSKNHKRAFHSIALFPDNGYAKAAHAIRGVPMSALGQERTSRIVERMSALPPKAEIGIKPRQTSAPSLGSWGLELGKRWRATLFRPRKFFATRVSLAQRATTMFFPHFVGDACS